jgi:hypothetical protein
VPVGPTDATRFRLDDDPVVRTVRPVDLLDLHGLVLALKDYGSHYTLSSESAIISDV